MTAWCRDAHIGASIDGLREIYLMLEMQEVGTSHREAVKVTLFVFLSTTWTKIGPVIFNYSWPSDGLLCVSQRGSHSK